MFVVGGKNATTTTIEPAEAYLSRSTSIQTPEKFGKPVANRKISRKDQLALIGCLMASSVAMVVVFVPRLAVHFGQDGQFIWIGLCLTIMGWCTQHPLRRMFLILATNSQASTLQTFDAVLRSDPFADKADWSFRFVLVIMLALNPMLSIAYKRLGDGTARYGSATVQVSTGLTGPPGTQNIGYGLSQFVNATLPWFQGSGGEEQAYGFNTYVPDERTAVILDGPMPTYLLEAQASLGSRQTKYVTGTVTALVCSLSNNTSLDADTLNDMMANEDFNEFYASSTWVWDGDKYRIGLVLPSIYNNTDIYYAAYNVTNNETFGSRAQHYELWRQRYNATWHITPTTIQLHSAKSNDHQPVLDNGVFTDNRVSIVELYLYALVEYDTRFRSISPSSALNDSAEKSRKNNAVPLGLMVWARMVAWWGPETWTSHEEGVPDAAQRQAMHYDSIMTEEIEAVVNQRDWRIALVLLLSPVILILSLASRVLYWPHAAIGEGFSIVSILASVEAKGLTLLKGAGLSGHLQRKIFLGFWSEEERSSRKRHLVTTLGIAPIKSQKLESGKMFY
ncbi:hypothetical protein P153DRAFT_363085 [Dothidotthia symphoricarpi CBS 119687]|uniref:Uncharacterized protein n=1 Tax=Dothidotthia symphoricarpi CBS 119687 TaxID=1392245 RepID=A0A6A6AS97_9PLEO|nr:uncharacterized protein P153DRAFT_363085 [Dothidotthia symphoricarpi CBS 119687]KAF2134083.1 hypothetical protein P153DRAFT_363085 [Dothidotthia symphoricarpi CBS 119687]